MSVRFLKSESSPAFSATSCVSELSVLCVKIRFLAFFFCSQPSTVDCRLSSLRSDLCALSASAVSPSSSCFLPRSPLVTRHSPLTTFSKFSYSRTYGTPGEGGYTGLLVRPRRVRGKRKKAA